MHPMHPNLPQGIPTIFVGPPMHADPFGPTLMGSSVRRPASSTMSKRIPTQPNLLRHRPHPPQRPPKLVYPRATLHPKFAPPPPTQRLVAQPTPEYPNTS